MAYDFAGVPSLPDDCPSLFTLPEYLVSVKERGVSLESDVGHKRFEGMIEEFSSRQDIRLVEGQFKLGNRTLWVLTRVRVPLGEDGVDRHDLAVVLSGISYFGPGKPPERDDVDSSE